LAVVFKLNRRKRRRALNTYGKTVEDAVYDEDD